MLSAIKKIFYATKIKAMMKHFDIHILHHIPGRIRLQSDYWKDAADQMQPLLKELDEENRIRSVKYTSETGTLLVFYDKERVSCEEQIERWMTRLNYLLNEFNQY